MDIPALIRRRLDELDLEQRNLAVACRVTESYVSQLLTRKKAPPSPERTDIYERMERFLKLPAGQLSKLAQVQRQEQWQKKLSDPPPPLYGGVRELVLRKCRPEKRAEVRQVFERETFGSVERVITQKLVDVVKRVAREELDSEEWLRIVARLSGRSYEQARVRILEFLDTDIFNLSDDNCVAFLDPLIAAWDIDLTNFGIEIVLNRRLAPGLPRKFELTEQPSKPKEVEAGLLEFLRERLLSDGVTAEEIEFLQKLEFGDKRPTALYYYRELQNLRDPLHFRTNQATKRRAADRRVRAIRGAK